MLRSQFSDVDMQFSEEELETAISESQALEIVDYVHAVAPHVDGILVHCRGGVSRSAAVAKWIAKTLGLPFNHQYALFNTHVYDQLIHATACRDKRPKP